MSNSDQSSVEISVQWYQCEVLHTKIIWDSLLPAIYQSNIPFDQVRNNCMVQNMVVVLTLNVVDW